jgi:hypothetical protein
MVPISVLTKLKEAGYKLPLKLADTLPTGLSDAEPI